MTKKKTEDQFAAALKYYLAHLKVDLEQKRMELRRHYMDPLCAMLNGYVTYGQHHLGGDHNKYKRSCYASLSAIAELNEKRIEETTMEHVVPLNVVGEILLKKLEKTKGCISDRKLLNQLNLLVIPCVITKKENERLNGEYKKNMPSEWTCVWARYKDKKVGLFNEIRALRNGLPGPMFEDNQIAYPPNDLESAHSALSKF